MLIHPPTTRHLTPADVAERLNCSAVKVRELIASRQLPAINTSLNPRGKKPRWMITLADLEAFERSRATKPAAVPASRPRKRDQTGVIQFFS